MPACSGRQEAWPRREDWRATPRLPSGRELFRQSRPIGKSIPEEATGTRGGMSLLQTGGTGFPEFPPSAAIKGQPSLSSMDLPRGHLPQLFRVLRDRPLVHL
jgi:hypothetical protein